MKITLSRDTKFGPDMLVVSDEFTDLETNKPVGYIMIDESMTPLGLREITAWPMRTVGAVEEVIEALVVLREELRKSEDTWKS